MPLRCLLFSSDEETAHSIGLVLADLGMESDYTHLAVEAVKRVSEEVFQIVIVDWNNAEEAGFLIKTARERKASERPLNLAIVSDDKSVPEALRAGANSVLRKPILANQAKDTLTTARDLLRSRAEAPVARAAAAAAGVPSGVPVVAPPPTFPIEALPATEEPTLRAGEFLQSAAPSPGAQFVTESEEQRALENPPAEETDPLSGLMSTAEAMPNPPRLPDPPRFTPALTPASDEPRGLEWYLKNRGAAAAPAQPTAPAEKPEMLGYNEAAAYNPDPEPAQPAAEVHSLEDALKRAKRGQPSPETSMVPGSETQAKHEEKTEAALFAHIAGETPKKKGPSFLAKLQPWLGKIALVSALVAVAAFVYWKVPRELWGKNVHMLVAYSQHSLHTWLNPQPVPSTPPAPRSHENFGRAGDEYKLPAAENIPDATTDPTQIRVVPVVDPTAKQPNAAANPDQTAGQANAPGQAGTDPSAVQVSPTPAADGQPAQPTPVVVPGATGSAASGTPSVTPSVPAEAHANVPAATVQPPPPAAGPMPVAPAEPPASRPVPSASSSAIPSSLKSQMASMTPDASGNKPVDAALPTIEPVKLPEATVRALLVQQNDAGYPESARGQKGTVVLQVLIGRDGTVQDAKFLQGSLAFARSAIDSVLRWKFTPYIMNGRPVSVQTQLTLNFMPAS